MGQICLNVYMNTLVRKTQYLLRRIQGYLPLAIPIDRDGLEAWMSNIIVCNGFPDNDTTKGALSVMLMHLGPTDSHKPARYFVKCLRKAAAAQIAGAIFTEGKEKYLKAAKEAADAEKLRLAEAPATDTGAKDGQGSETSV